MSDATGTVQQQQTTRKYKDTFFRYLFSEQQTALGLYNALTGEQQTGTVEFLSSNEIAAKYNDLAFKIGSQFIFMGEHQSTPNMNMPVRILQYAVQDVYSHYLSLPAIYRAAQIALPVPRFFMLYNGTENFYKDELRLSDAFPEGYRRNPALELVVKVVNIRFKSNNPVLRKSTELYGYSYLIYQIEENLKSMERDTAIRKAIAVCIENKILTDFLKNNYEEAIKVMTYTYNEEFARQALIEEGEARGEARGVAIGEARGVALGEARGVALGEARGVALGEARGEVIKAKAIALVMMADGENINKIVRYTGLNEEEVNRIYSEFIIPTINAPN